MKNNQAFAWVWIIIVLAIILAGGVWYYTQADVPEPDVSTPDITGNNDDQASQTLSFIYPTEGTEWSRGSTYTIRWNTPESVSRVSISASSECGTPRSSPCPTGSNPADIKIAIDHPNTGSVDWTVPNNIIGYWRIVIGSSDPDNTIENDMVAVKIKEN